jgi:hypothetical protein
MYFEVCSLLCFFPLECTQKVVGNVQKNSSSPTTIVTLPVENCHDFKGPRFFFLPSEQKKGTL